LVFAAGAKARCHSESNAGLKARSPTAKARSPTAKARSQGEGGEFGWRRSKLRLYDSYVTTDSKSKLRR